MFKINFGQILRYGIIGIALNGCGFFVYIFFTYNGFNGIVGFRQEEKYNHINVNYGMESYGRHHFSVMGTQMFKKKTKTNFLVNYTPTGRFVDENNDGFTDVIQDNKIVLYNNWEF